MTLLDAILTLQDEQDGTLAIRYSCRSSICGSCACKADGKTVLACMSQVEDVKKEFGGGHDRRWTRWGTSRRRRT